MQTPEGARRRIWKTRLFPLLSDSDTDDVAVPLHAKSIKMALVGLSEIAAKERDGLFEATVRGEHEFSHERKMIGSNPRER